jgi:hypothetical protein
VLNLSPLRGGLQPSALLRSFRTGGFSPGLARVN